MASINLQGDTSGAITISAPSVAGSNTLTLPATTQTLATQNALGVRNLIINGDMRIAQRGTSVAGITSSGYFTVDRFGTLQTGLGTWTHSQDTDVPSGQGFSNSLKLDCTTADATLDAGDRLFLRQGIEAQNLQHLKFGTASAESITLSFWVKTNKTGTYSLAFINADPVRSYVTTYTVSSADTWEKKTITIDGDTSGSINNDNGVGMWIYWNFGAGSTWGGGTVNNAWETTVNANLGAGTTVNLADSTSNYINITGVQLEVGDTATPFEHRPYDMELARCQRYFENLQLVYPGMQGANYGSSSGSFIAFKVEKRAVPSITDATIRNGASGATTSVAASTAWTTLCSGRFPHTGLTATTGQGVHVYATNGIHVDAEL